MANRFASFIPVGRVKKAARAATMLATLLIIMIVRAIWMTITRAPILLRLSDERIWTISNNLPPNQVSSGSPAAARSRLTALQLRMD
jgi:hypothetical protein